MDIINWNTCVENRFWYVFYLADIIGSIWEEKKSQEGSFFDVLNFWEPTSAARTITHVAEGCFCFLSVDPQAARCVSALIWSSASLSLFCCTLNGAANANAPKRRRAICPLSPLFCGHHLITRSVMECSKNENNKTQCQECATQISAANDLYLAERAGQMRAVVLMLMERKRDAI